MFRQLMSLPLWSSLGLLLLHGCSGEDGLPSFDVADRLPGVRAPRTAACDDMDQTRCLLPFP